MKKIASPNEALEVLQEVISYVRTNQNPERAVLAESLRSIAARIDKKAADGKFVGKDARLTWGRWEMFLEELPQKGKKKLLQGRLAMPGGGLSHLDWFLPENLLMLAKLTSGDDYEKIKSKLTAAVEEAFEKTAQEKRPQGKYPSGEAMLADNTWIKESLTWHEGQVFYLKVTPENVEPFLTEGKDFKVKCTWTSFSSYSPNSDFNQMDAHYTEYASSAPTSGRKLYQMLKASPDALRSVSWNDFGKWLDANKIGYKTHFSQWH